MNSIVFSDAGLFRIAVSALEMDATPEYDLDTDTLTVHSFDIDGVSAILHDNGIFSFIVRRNYDEPFDGFRTDAEADGDALKSAGFGTDEDYGSYGSDE
jgi:hypothetical protein